MKKSPERLDFMTRQLKSLNLPFAVEEGVDGASYDFSGVYDEELSRKLNGWPLSRVERGCALSHRHCLERVVHENLDYALIMEDDVELPAHFKKIVDHAIADRQRGSTDWEYLSFNYPTVGLKFVRLWLYLLIHERFKKHATFALFLQIPFLFLKFIGISIFSLFEGVRDALYKKLSIGKPARFYRPMYLAGCYLVTQEGARKILSVSDKIIYPADRIQTIARAQKGLKLYWFVPLLVKQRRDKFESTMNKNEKYVFRKYD